MSAPGCPLQVRANTPANPWRAFHFHPMADASTESLQTSKNSQLKNHPPFRDRQNSLLIDFNLVALYFKIKSAMKTKLKLTAVFEEAEEGGYITFIEELPGVNSQGETLEEAKSNLLEAMHMVLESHREISEKAIANKKITKETLELIS